MKPPTTLMIESYIENIVNKLLKDEVDKNEIMDKFMLNFEQISKDTGNDEKWKAACRIVSKKLVRNNLALRRKSVGEFLNAIRMIAQQSFGVDTFEEGSHSVSSEPYFRETSYKDPAMKEVLVIDRTRRILKTEQRTVIDENEYSLDRIAIAADIDGKCYLNLDDEKSCKTWKCTIACKTLCIDEIQSIIDLKNEFSDECIETAREVLQLLDTGCEHEHYDKPSDIDKEDNELEIRKGHPFPCASGYCSSWLRMLRAAAVHYPSLRSLLNNIYRARRSDNNIREIESSLSEGSVCSLKNKLNLHDLSELLDDEFLDDKDSPTTECESLSTSESQLEVKFTGIIEEFYGKLKEDPEFSCCSCERLLLKKSSLTSTSQCKNLRALCGYS